MDDLLNSFYSRGKFFWYWRKFAENKDQNIRESIFKVQEKKDSDEKERLLLAFKGELSEEAQSSPQQAEAGAVEETDSDEDEEESAAEENQEEDSDDDQQSNEAVQTEEEKS